MKMMVKILSIVLLLLPISSYAQNARESTALKKQFDLPSLIKKSTLAHQANFKKSEKQAVVQMDEMLVHQYASGRIMTEPNAYLKTLYYQAAYLLLNGFPIAGGTVVAIARIQPGFSSSAAGRGLADFVDAMLSGDDDEPDDLTQYMERTKSAQKILKSLRFDVQLSAQLRVVGEIYHDDVAVDAGKLGLRQLGATPAEEKIIETARKVK